MARASRATEDMLGYLNERYGIARFTPVAEGDWWTSLERVVMIEK
jgi:hypothetical protein